MKYTRALFLLFIVLFFVSLSPLNAQTGSSNSSMPSTQFDTTGFPQWGKDLRRGEIIAFGAFPFAYFFTNFGIDLYRCRNNDWDRRYAPWPFDAAGSIDKTKDERIMTISIAAGGAVLIALVDYTIVRYKRSVQEREIRNLPPGTPIIIRTPMREEEGEVVYTDTMLSDPPEAGDP